MAVMQPTLGLLGERERLLEDLARAREELQQALEAWEAAWGPTDGRSALPQAVQLTDRIALGEVYVQEHPEDAQAAKHLRQLRARQRLALADPMDRRRCEEWRLAGEAYDRAEARYLALVREARAQGLEETAA